MCACDAVQVALPARRCLLAQFFESLRYVVIDEMHSYRGVFGSHVANVLRRLQRICRFYGSEPLFILCSATIANPAELASQLIDAEVSAITDSGAPAGARHLLLWNPPVINPDLEVAVNNPKAKMDLVIPPTARIDIRYRHLDEDGESEVFDIELEGKIRREGYEPCARGFRTAEALHFAVDVDGGSLDLRLHSVVGRPSIAGIEIASQ